MTKIILRKGSGVPDPNALAEAELALDVGIGALYSRLEDGAVHQLNDFSGSGDWDNISNAPTSTCLCAIDHTVRMLT